MHDRWSGVPEKRRLGFGALALADPHSHPDRRAALPQAGCAGRSRLTWGLSAVLTSPPGCNAPDLALRSTASTPPSHTPTSHAAMATAALCSAAPRAPASLRTAWSGAEAARPAAAVGSLVQRHPPLRLPRGLSVLAQANKVSVRKAGGRCRAVVVEAPTGSGGAGRRHADWLAASGMPQAPAAQLPASRTASSVRKELPGDPACCQPQARMLGACATAR